MIPFVNLDEEEAGADTGIIESNRKTAADHLFYLPPLRSGNIIRFACEQRMMFSLRKDM